MFWRVLLVICSLTFLNAGCQVLGDEDCKSVDIGGNRRVISYECHRNPDTGEFSQGAAGGLGIAIGLGMILLDGWPWISASLRNQQRGVYPPYSTRPNSVSTQQAFLRAVAALLHSVVGVKGAGSREWERAIEVLVQFSDGSLSVAAAERLLKDASQTDLQFGHLDEEHRLLLLRVGIEVAAADGKISPIEVSALEALATRLGFDAQVLRVLIEMVTGDVTGPNQSEFYEARQLLGVGPDASTAEIRSSYKQMMKKHHPDLAPPDQRKAATQKAAEINDAYNLLIGLRKKSGTNSSGTSGTRSSQSDQTSGGARSGTSSTTTRTRQCVNRECTMQLPKTAKFCGTCGHPQT